ncbi:MAG: hypothetical protein AAFW73_23850 [Bacteroidota bacterium]
MEGLLSYISIIDPRLLRHITGKPGDFIALLQEQNYISEEAFMRRVCGGEIDRKYYGGLKSRTISILQALAIISSPDSQNPVKKKYEICQKKFLVGQKFLLKGERKEGIKLIKQAYQIAVAYSFMNPASELASVLYHHHIYYQPNDKLADLYYQQSEQFLKDHLAEKRAEHCLYQAIRQIGKNAQPQIMKNAIEQMERLGGNSIKYQNFLSTARVLYGLNVKDYRSVIKICRSAISFFEGKTGVNISHMQFFWSKLGIAQMASSNFHDARQSFEQAQFFAPAKSYNDYVLRYYQALNDLRAGNYSQAYGIYRQNRRCRFAPLRLQFAILEAYLCFLAYTGNFQFDGIFRLGKFLNDTFKAQTEKQGDNLTVVIAELLVLLARDRGKFIDRIEAVQHYSYRHLRGEDTRRAYWFIKILCLLPKVNFHPDALKRRAKTYLEKLEHHPVASGENFAIEIIPFDRLLRMILRQLQQKVA